MTSHIANTLPIDRRKLIAGAAALTGVMMSDGARADAMEPAFLVVGDWGRDGASHQRDVAAQMETAAARSGAAFVVSVGDNFYDNGVQSVTDPQWKTSFEDVYTGPHLQAPWYVVLGNHDYRGVPQAQVDYTQKSPRWRMPSRWFKVAGGDAGLPGADLFVIDTTPLVHDYALKIGSLGDNVKSQDTAAQLAWLDAELTASTAPIKLVFGHHTMFSGGSGHGNTPEIIDRVLPILRAHKVTAYINGHDHDLQHIIRDGMNVICTGAGSEVRPVSAVEGTQFCASQSGFSLFRLGTQGLHLDFIAYTGATLYSAAIA